MNQAFDNMDKLIDTLDTAIDSLNLTKSKSIRERIDTQTITKSEAEKLLGKTIEG